MSYQVLARKWRPKSFHTLVGQEHVLKALINALDSGRLHHAYLFTGTRGVGKTTISRILAKCLNCESGVTSTPCGQCSACTAIDEGRFVDLIEVDAASRTKVEDTRELLENVQYRPTAGRYKVYLIDEVHMLSNHSFNALLKTLEEPPPHVKFLLATTDPQKLPVTILSRCLKFHLKNLTPERIEAHLAHVLEQEGIAGERSALRMLAKAAQGSMRDALSLLDQAIAHGEGKVGGAEVGEMLGAIDRDHIYRMVSALADDDGPSLMAAVARCAEFSPDFEAVLSELLSFLHRIAVLQTVPELEPASFDDGERVVEFAARLSPEDVQLYYQIGLHGRRDLPLSADTREGLEMCLLRMLAFRPDDGEGTRREPGPRSTAATPVAVSSGMAGGAGLTSEHSAPVAEVSAPPPAEAMRGTDRPAVPAMPAPESSSTVASGPSARPMPGSARSALAQARAALVQRAPESPSLQVRGEITPEATPRQPPPRLSLVSREHSELASKPVSESRKPGVMDGAPIAMPLQEPFRDEAVVVAAAEGHWWAIAERLEISGAIQQMAFQCQWLGRREDTIHLRLDRAAHALNTPARIEKLQSALAAYFGEPVRVALEEGEISEETPAQRRQRIDSERLTAATESLERDEVLLALKNRFNASVDAESIKAL